LNGENTQLEWQGNRDRISPRRMKKTGGGGGGAKKKKKKILQLHYVIVLDHGNKKVDHVLETGRNAPKEKGKTGTLREGL